MADETPPATTAPSTTSQSTTAPSTTAPSTTAPSTTSQSTTAPSTTSQSTIAPSTTAPSTTAPSTTDPSTTAPSTTPPSTTAPSTTAPSTTAPSTTAPSTTPQSTTAPSTTPQSTTAPSTTAPSTTPQSTTAPSTSTPSTTAPPTTGPSNTDPSTTAPSGTAPSVTPSSTALATDTKIPSNMEKEDKTRRETDESESKGEETQRLPKLKTRSGTERKVKRQATPSVPEADKVSHEVTFRFHLKNCSKVNAMLSSAPCWLHGIPWMIKAGPVTLPSKEEENKTEKYLSLALRCGGVWGAAFWACYGTMELSLLPVNKYQAAHAVGIECLFDKTGPTGGLPNFMLWENVLNPDHGYIKDDAVTFQVRLRTAPPYVVNWASDRLVRVPMQTLPVFPPHVTGGRKDMDSDSGDDEDDSDDDDNDDDVNKDEGLYAQKNLHMYI